MSILLPWHLLRLCANYYCTDIFQRGDFTALELMCRKVFLFLNGAVEQTADGKGREPCLAWNQELADLMENRET